MPFDIFDRRSGKTYKWSGPNQPTPDEARRFIYEQEHKTLWQKANEPLWEGPSRLARRISEGISNSRRTSQSPGYAAMHGFLEGATEGAGDLLSSFSSPLSLGLTAVTLGSGTAAKAGLGGTARALNAVERAAGAGMVGHGGYQLSQAETLGDVGAAGLEIAGGALGARARVPQMGTTGQRAPRRSLPLPRSRTRFAAGAEGTIDRNAPLTRDTRLPVLEGEVLPPITPAGLPGRVGEPLALPEARAPYFSSRRGVSPDIEAVSEPTRYPRSAEEGAFNALIPNRYKPVQSNLPDMPPYEYVPPGDPNLSYTGTGRLLDTTPEVTPPRSAVPTLKTGFENTPDNDVEFLAGTGDKSALAEARKRPGLWARLKERFKDETGAIGPGADDLIKKNKGRAETAEYEKIKQARSSQVTGAETLLDQGDEAANARIEAWRAKGGLPAQPRKGLVNWIKSKLQSEKDKFTDPAERQAWLKEGQEIIRDEIARYRDATGKAKKVGAQGMPEGQWKNKMRITNPELFEGEGKLPDMPDLDLKSLDDSLRDLEGRPIAPPQNVPKPRPPGPWDENVGPETPKIDKGDWPGDRQREGFREFLRSRGVPEETIKSYTDDQLAEAVRRQEKEGGFLSVRGANNKRGRGMFSRAANPAKGTPYEKDFANWVNSVRASRVEGKLKGREFRDLDELGTEGILAFQHGSRTGRLKELASYFDQKFADLTKAGVRLDYRENYLPQIWEDSPDKVKEVYRRLGLRPSFTLNRVFEDYATGIEHGLTPKFKNISQLVDWYEGKANKAIADRQFYELAKKNEWIKPQGKGGPDWQILDPNHFPSVRMKVKGRNEVRVLPMTAPPELAEIIGNYLAKPQRHLENVADVTSFSKNLAMSAGVPYTGVNAHGFNILARTVMSDPKRAFDAGKYMLNPRSAGRALDQALHTAPWAVRKGLTLTTENHELGISGTDVASKSLQGFLSKTGPMFEDPLFQNMIPALKLKHFNDMVDDMVKQGMTRDQAGEQAAQFINNVYGGINWEAMGRSRDLQNIARSFILAPDWFETNLRLGKGTAKALTDPKNPQGRTYNKMARNILGMYVGANVINYASSGHFMWENSPGHALDVYMGRNKDGKDRWFRPFGTAADFLRLPFDAASSALRFDRFGQWKPDLGTTSQIIKNRLSTTASPAINLLTKRDRFGRPILGRDDYGRPLPAGTQIGGVAGELSGIVTPPYVKSAIDFGTGRVGGEEALLGSIESPVRYSSPPRSERGRRRRQSKR